MGSTKQRWKMLRGIWEFWRLREYINRGKGKEQEELRGALGAVAGTEGKIHANV